MLANLLQPYSKDPIRVEDLLGESSKPGTWQSISEEEYQQLVARKRRAASAA